LALRATTISTRPIWAKAPIGTPVDEWPQPDGTPHRLLALR
jgi:hypothetical protein